MTAKTREYVVYRLGSNTSNQPMCQKCAIGIVEASNPREASFKARGAYGRRCYNNQSLAVVAAYHASRDDYDSAYESDQQNQQWQAELAGWEPKNERMD